jgi:hypothetical protein
MAVTSTNTTRVKHVVAEGERVAWDGTVLSCASTLGALRFEAKKNPVRLTGLGETSSRLGLRCGRRDRLSGRRVVLVVMLAMMLLGRGRAASGRGGSGRGSRRSDRGRSLRECGGRKKGNDTCCGDLHFHGEKPRRWLDVCATDEVAALYLTHHF